MKDFITISNTNDKKYDKDFMNFTYKQRITYYNSLSKYQIVSLLERLVFPEEEE